MACSCAFMQITIRFRYVKVSFEMFVMILNIMSKMI